jgi:integrase/recombinase XerD
MKSWKRRNNKNNNKKKTKRQRVKGDENEMLKLRDRYLDWLQIKDYSATSITNRKYGLKYFILWCDERGMTGPQDVSPDVLERYQRHLYNYRKKDGAPLSISTQWSRLIMIRSFFRWLFKSRLILSNPASDIELPRPDNRLPRNVLSFSEVEKILSQPDLSSPLGLRDRAILELLFSTGIRRSELVNLNLYDVDSERSMLFIRKGKGKKDRVVPTGERALLWLERYLDESRPLLAGKGDGDVNRDKTDNHKNALFLNSMGTALQYYTLGNVVGDYIKSSGIDKKGNCHIFRHSMATLMLDGGADIRYIQQMLGHAKLETTQVYTRVSMKKLKEVHQKTHPGATLKRKKQKRQ